MTDIIFNIDNAKYPLVDDPNLSILERDFRIHRYVWQAYSFSPVSLDGAKILDVGKLGDFWKTLINKEYPSADFKAIDIPDFPTDPSTATFDEVKAMLKGLPYNDNTFDLIQQGYRSSSFTEQQLKENVFNEYIRVLKPGGWIEILDFDQELLNPGEAYKKMQAITNGVLIQGGYNPTPRSFLSEFFKSHKDFTNFKFIERKHPVGKWGGKLGEIVINQWELVSKKYELVTKNAANFTDEEYLNITTKFFNEVEEQKSYWSTYRIIAQKKN